MRIGFLALAVVAVGCGGLSPLPDGGVGGGGGSAGYELNDVSFLYPLPGWDNRDGLMSMTSAGDQGALMPKALFDQLPVMIVGVDNSQIYRELRVVSLRVDPCFPGSTPPAAKVCKKQVRMVAQPLVQQGLDAGMPQSATETLDTTVHLFFSLSDSQFETALDGVKALKRLAGDQTKGPLNVNPVMKAQGLGGDYAKALNAMALKVCGDATLTRVAFMAFNPSFGNRWTFGAFDRAGAQLVESEIPRTNGKTIQGVVELGVGGTTRAGELVPSITGDDLPTLLESLALVQADDGTLKRALTSALQIEHPDRSSPRTIDCGSCHVASRARTNAERVRKIDTSTWPDAFKSDRYDLRRVDGAAEDPRALRSFGYFGALSALSQRTINESAAIAADLSVSAPY